MESFRDGGGGCQPRGKKKTKELSDPRMKKNVRREVEGGSQGGFFSKKIGFENTSDRNSAPPGRDGRGKKFQG